MTPDRPTLAELVEAARARGPMTPEEIEAQRRSYVRAEAAFGSDAGEAAMVRALADRDWPAVERLEAAADERAVAVDRAFGEGADPDRPQPAAPSAAPAPGDALAAEVAALREALEEVKRLAPASLDPRLHYLAARALATPSAAADALVERVRAEALEEAAKALPRILKIFGAGCSVAGPARVGGSGHDDPNPAGCPDCVEAAAAAIRALKGGKHG